MSEVRIAKRYAKSLLDLSIERSCIDEIYNDLKLFNKTIKENRQLQLALKNPVIKQAQKKIILNKLFSSKVNQLTSLFFDMVCRKGRASVLPYMGREFITLFNEHMGIKNATVITAYALTDDLKKEFESLVSKISESKKVILESKTDASVVGGYVLKIGDRQIDDSIGGRLKLLKNKLVTKDYNQKI